MNNQPNIPQQLAEAWRETFPRTQVKPVFYDPAKKHLTLECPNQASLFQTRLTGGVMAKKVNDRLGTRLIEGVRPRLRTIRILVTGSRSWEDVPTLADVLLETWHDVVQTHPEHPVVIVHGDCYKGADFFTRHWARASGLPQEKHPADWTGPCAPECPEGHRLDRGNGATYCPTAGPRRNEHMVQLGADILVAFQNGNSRGTADCIRRAAQAGIPVRRITS